MCLPMAMVSRAALHERGFGPSSCLAVMRAENFCFRLAVRLERLVGRVSYFIGVLAACMQEARCLPAAAAVVSRGQTVLLLSGSGS